MKAIPLIATHRRSARPVHHARALVEKKTLNNRSFFICPALNNQRWGKSRYTFFNDVCTNRILSLGTPEPSMVTGHRAISSPLSSVKTWLCVAKKPNENKIPYPYPYYARIHPY